MLTEGIVFNIQKFSLHDGPGIRTVIFLKGCPLRCQWCANPESQLLLPQVLRDRTMAGEVMTVESVVAKVMQDEAFYRQSGGGATISGGEPLAQIDFAEALCEALHEQNLTVAVETTGYAEPQIFTRLTAVADIFLYDLKHHDARKHEQYTGVSNELILANLAAAVATGKPVTVRIPVIPGVNDSLDDMSVFGSLLVRLGVRQANLLPFHQLGENKYLLMNIPYAMKDIKALHKEDLAQLVEILRGFGLQVKIGG